jgi:hypothetical protein
MSEEEAAAPSGTVAEKRKGYFAYSNRYCGK